MKHIIIILLFFLTACGSADYTADSQGTWGISQTGLNVKIPDSLYTNGLWSQSWVLWDKYDIDSKIMSQVEFQVSSCLAKHPSYRDKAYSILYVLFDDYAFPCSASNTGLCAGYTDYSLIKASIYSRWKGNSYPTFQTAPHLIRTKEDLYRISGNDIWIKEGSNYYASLEPTIPVICHELEHIFYGGSYGHSVHVTVFEVKGKEASHEH